ncbi:MAG: 3-isopropylmalate dehydratase large subunit [Betaproteobacteria bacterium]
MSMTLTEKILAAHAGQERVSPGELVNARVDLALANDITAPVAIKAFREMGAERVFDPERVALVPDHFTPNKDIPSAEQAKVLREFAREQGLPYYYEVGRMGIEHCLIPEEGLALPGELIVGADSHTCTYGALGAFATGVGSTDLAAAMALGELWLRVPETVKFVLHGRPRNRWVGGKDYILFLIGQVGVDGCRYQAMEFHGPAVAELPLDGRFTMANMAIEAGAKNGIFPPDEATLSYLAGRAKRPFTPVYPDPDAAYAAVYEYDVTALEPQVAFPFSPANVRPVSEAGGVAVDQVVIGSCTNGRLSDLRVAAEVLRGRAVHPHVRCLVFPGTPRIYRQALAEGLIEALVAAGAAVSTPTCGPCLGGHLGIMAAGERTVSTTNRNFRGRMGHVTSEVYLASPAVAAASAVAGFIVSPDDL